jgi:DNA mismatch repair protein MutS2
VLEIDERKKRLRLDFDGVSLWAEAGDVELAEGNAPAALSAERGGTRTLPGTACGTRIPQDALGRSAQNATVCSSVPYAPVSLDIRGEYADTVTGGLTRFLDRAAADGRTEVEIIHGRGTGVLRREVHAFLRSFPAVRSFRLAPEDRGGDGMTIVEL